MATEQAKTEARKGTRFAVGKQFTEGPLKGLTITDDSPVAFEVGKTYGGGWLGSRYVVTSCEERAS